jgi:ParB family chromosome partitioning protein
MAKVKEFASKLPSVDELFTTQEERDDVGKEKVELIPLDLIDEFPDHPFQVNVDDEMRKMVESVKAMGVHTPALARKKDDGRYELISGHRRRKASELAGNETLPVIVKDVDRDTAICMMVDANMQRTEILPSEKAHAYKMKLEAIRRKAGRPAKNNLAPVGQNLSGKFSRDIVAEESGDSKSQVQRYIRLNELIPEILQMVDEKQIAFRPAVELSYLTEELQQDLYEQMDLEMATPSLSQSIRLHRLADENRLDHNVIYSILLEEKPNQKEQLKIPYDHIKKYFKEGTTPKEREETIIKALELYRRRERNRQMER